MLLFFIGMEVSPRRLAANWKLAVLGTSMQIAVSVGLIWLLGIWLDWPFPRIVLLGFVISLSSTAVVLKLLEDWQELDSKVGQDALGVLLVQDLAVVPMMITIGLLSGEGTNPTELTLQIVGGIGIITLAVWVTLRNEIRLPWLRALGNDHEMQVFAALTICFGLALITGLMHLSTALGAFVAGMVVAAARETDWVHHSLQSLKVIFIALFFLSIGMLIDLNFLQKHLLEIAVLVVIVMLINTLINATTLRLFGDSWRESLYTGAILSQVGEFSFILVAVGLQADIINPFSYQMTISIIALSLFLSPAWIMTVKHSLGVNLSVAKVRQPH